MAAFEYKFKFAGTHKVSAEVAGKVCEELTNTADGLTPKRLVDAARPVNSPMHNEFEWDDGVAAEKYREEQAALVIRHLIVVRTDNEKDRELRLIEDQEETIDEEIEDEEDVVEPVDRGFVSTGERTSKYVTLYSALSNEEWKKNLLEAAKRDMRAFTAKYHRLEELSKIVNDMNDFLGA